MIVETREGPGNLALRVRSGGGANTRGQLVALLLTAVEAITGVSADGYVTLIEEAAGTDPAGEGAAA